MAWLAKLSAGLTRLAEILVVFSFTAMGIAIMAQICMRTAGYTLLSMEDISFFGLFWLVFTGMAVAFRQHSHVTVDFVAEWLPPTGRRVMDLVALGLVLIFLALFTWSGVRLTIDNVQQYAMQLRISMIYIYFILPLGGAISLVIVLGNFLETARALFGRRAA